MLPKAIPNDARNDPDVVRLTRRAPSAMPGQIHGPTINTAASAIPVGGHTALVLALRKARLSPSRPATKYASTSAPMHASLAEIDTGARSDGPVVLVI